MDSSSLSEVPRFVANSALRPLFPGFPVNCNGHPPRNPEKIATRRETLATIRRARQAASRRERFPQLTALEVVSAGLPPGPARIIVRMFPDLSLPQQIAVWSVPVLLAITLHEVAHGWAARALGDPTAANLGRLSLNPLRHIDPVGTVIVPGVLLALGGFLFGWAKPVPVNMYNLRRPRQHMALVALAGPGANLVMAIGWALLLKLSMAQDSTAGTWEYLGYTAVAGVLINLVLMVLNLLPMPPLDGGRVLAGLVPESTARVLDQVERWGLLLLVALLATGVLGKILSPLLQLAQGALFTLVQLPGR